MKALRILGLMSLMFFVVLFSKNIIPLQILAVRAGLSWLFAPLFTLFFVSITISLFFCLLLYSNKKLWIALLALLLVILSETLHRGEIFVPAENIVHLKAHFLVRSLSYLLIFAPVFSVTPLVTNPKGGRVIFFLGSILFGMFFFSQDPIYRDDYFTQTESKLPEGFTGPSYENRSVVFYLSSGCISCAALYQKLVAMAEQIEDKNKILLVVHGERKQFQTFQRGAESPFPVILRSDDEFFRESGPVLPAVFKRKSAGLGYYSGESFNNYQLYLLSK